MQRVTLIGNEIFYRTGKTSAHPLAWPKTAPTLELIKSFSWFDEASYVECATASPRRLGRFHDAAYVDAALDAEAMGGVDVETGGRYGIGSDGNPFFPGVIDRARVACGAAIKAAGLLVDGGIVHSPLGGAHHSRPARASGFGYFNDIAIGIHALRDKGIRRIAYVDIDAHHGDGVEAAFADQQEVLTLSVHEEDCWPHSGTHCEEARNIYNYPVPAGFNDTDMAQLLKTTILPRVEAFAPDAIVLQAGTDSLAADAMMKLSLSNRSYYRVVSALRDLSPRLWVTGGGGYNPWAVVRCWAGIWCVLNGRDPAKEAPKPMEAPLRALINEWPGVVSAPENWLDSLVDD